MRRRTVELRERDPLRFLCHTGHAFSLRSLLQTHSGATEEKLWSSLRTLQEKKALLERIATEDGLLSAEEAGEALAEANQLAVILDQLKALLQRVPSSVDLSEDETTGNGAPQSG